MNLSVGITGWLPQWRMILQQTGLPVETVNPLRPILPGDRGVILVTRRAGETERNNLLEYLAGGGAILTEADVAHWLLATETFPAFVRYVDPGDDPVFSHVVPGSVDARLLLPRRATLLESDSKKPLVEEVRYRKGTAIILPGMFTRAVLDTRSRRRNFPSPGPRLPSERVSRRSKSTFRTVVEWSLMYLFSRRGLPLVSLSPFPHGESTLFAFRVDTDFASERDIDALAALCHKHNIPATWFVETASAREFLSRFSALDRQETGVHCYRHRVLGNYVKNERDIYRAVRLLSREKIRARGYAAPFGLWNTALAKAVEHHGFIYSSEFTLDYDNLPFFPFLGERFSTVLQVPVHPITTGHLKNAHHSEENMKEYWRHRIADHERFHLPLIVYDHPSQANLEVLNWLFDEIRARGIPVLPLGDYARWWIERASLTWTAELEDETLKINPAPPHFPLWLIIRKSLAEQAGIELNETVPLKSLQWQKVEAPREPRTPMALVRTVNRKMIVNDILNRYWRLRAARRREQETR
ncbi:MAG: hypothetical protein ACE5LH_02250 [Fidelibacterota bacterium]